MSSKLAVFLAFLLLAIQSTSQERKSEIWREIGVISYHVATVATGALSEATRDEGQKSVAHAFRAMEVGLLIGGPFLFDVKKHEFLPYFLSYTFIRFSFFDAFYNKYRGLDLLYNGTTSSYDKFMNKMPPHGRAWWKTCSLVVGFSIPIKYL